MTKHSAIRTPQSAIVVVGAGPAGAGLAIRLAAAGHKVTLVEKEKFPREKLCGEFISPECFRHFGDLGVRDEMMSLGGARLTETRFFDAAGRSVSVPTRWFGHGDFALSLSRARMDAALLRRARVLGVNVLEGSRLTALGADDGCISSIAIRSGDGERNDISAALYVDATGRAGTLTRLLEKNEEQAAPKRPALVAFKNHLVNVETDLDACEIYMFDGGYGGLSPIEDGKANLCFIVRAEKTKQIIGKTNDHIGFVAGCNARAARTVRGAEPLGEWLAVPVSDFGRKSPPNARNAIAVGDAAAFIDPFTGSGMLLALESSELLAKCIAEHGVSGELQAVYAREHEAKFRKRLAACAMLRRAAFMPRLATAAILAAGLSDRLTERLARATRAGSRLSGGRV